MAGRCAGTYSIQRRFEENDLAEELLYNGVPALFWRTRDLSRRSQIQGAPSPALSAPSPALSAPSPTLSAPSPTLSAPSAPSRARPGAGPAPSPAPPATPFPSPSCSRLVAYATDRGCMCTSFDETRIDGRRPKYALYLTCTIVQLHSLYSFNSLLAAASLAF